MELELESILLPGVEDKRPMVIAGPCSAETEEQVMCTCLLYTSDAADE